MGRWVHEFVFAHHGLEGLVGAVVGGELAVFESFFDEMCEFEGHFFLGGGRGTARSLSWKWMLARSSRI